MIKLIVGYDENNLIGNGDKLAWDIKEDLEHFKLETLGKTILFGDVTFLGIGKPLPNRKTIILTLDKSFRYDHTDVEVCFDMNEIIQKYKNNKNEDIIIAGGATIYKIFLPFVDEMIVSHIKGKFKGDVYFPAWDQKEFYILSTEEKKYFTIKRYKKNNTP